MANSKKSVENRKRVVAGYVRVSTIRQAVEGDSLEAQQQAIEKYVERRRDLKGCDYELRLYVERGRSAKDQNRTQLSRLKREVQAGEIDVVVTGKLDRITRSLIDFATLWDFFKQYDTELVSIQEDFDTSTAMGEAMVLIIMVFAQLERKLTGERTRATMEDRTRRGLWNGGYVLGYRCDKEGRLTPDPDTVEKVQQIFDDFERLGSVGKVVVHHRKIGTRMPKRINRDGKPIGGKALSKQQASRLLQNRVYLGEVRWGGVRTLEAHQPIISEGQFDRVQILLERNRQTRTNARQPTERVFRLKGLVRCGCNNMMTPKNSTGRNGKHSYYVCTRKTHSCGGDCNAPYQPADALENAVIERLCQLSRDESARKRITEDALVHAAADGDRIKLELEQTRKRAIVVTGEIKKLVAVLKELGTAGIDSVKEELAELEAERKTLDQQAMVLKGQLSRLSSISDDGRRFIAEWKNVSELFENAEPDEQATLLQHLVEVVEIHPSNEDGKKGLYRLKLWSDQPDDDQPLLQEVENPPGGGPGADGAELRQNGAVLRADEKAPRKEPSSLQYSLF